MINKLAHRPLAGGAGEQDVDLAGQRVSPEYRSENRTRKAEFLRTDLAALRARYDGGAVSPALYKVIRQLETDLAWSEHHQVQR